MADIITIPMALAEFDKVQTDLDPTKTGVVHSKQIDFSYTFDGSNLDIDITARHTLAAKIASDALIKSHLEDLLAGQS